MWRAKVYPTVVSKFLLVLVDLHNNLFIVRTQLRNANLSKYQPWPSIQVTDRTASPIQLNYTSSIWNQILGSKHHFQFFIFFEHCAMCTDQTVMHRPNRDAQTKLWCTDQTVMHRPNCDAQTKLWCTDQTVMHRSNCDAQTKPYRYSPNTAHSESQRTDVTFTTGADLQAVQTSTLGTQECLNHILMVRLTANTCQPMGGTWTAASKSTVTLSVLQQILCGRILSVITGGKKMGRSCSTYGGEEKCTQGYCWETLRNDATRKWNNNNNNNNNRLYLEDT